MFAVPGWAVSASSLKTQAAEPHRKTSSGDVPTHDSHNVPETAGKKRKRRPGTQDVNLANVADMWDTALVGKQRAKKVKSSKPQGADTSQADTVGKVEDTHSGNTSTREKTEKKKSPKTEELLDNSQAEQHTKEVLEPPSSTSAHKPPSNRHLQPPKPSLQLTPLQASMRQKLISARFRHLNQSLYTAPSSQSLELFQQNPEMFNEYHEGFRRQVEVWPQNPVASYIEEIKARAKQKGMSKAGELPLLPRRQGTCTIVDLGCGEAAIAQALNKDHVRLNLKIRSYDLQSPNKFVTKADTASLPLKDGSVDIAIFCLALMGTNWIDFIEEAFRVLRWKGELWVAEIKSRFGRVSRNAGRVAHSVGNKKNLDKKTQKKRDLEIDDEIAEVEVDGPEDHRQETDVSAFVEVLKKRGFVLQDERIDLSNTMFVKLSFLKGCIPVKGKCVPVPNGMAEMGIETWRKKPKAKFLEEEVAGSKEATVLRPCVYKIR